MCDNEKSIIETIKSGQLPDIKLSESEANGLDVSQRGLEITYYGLDSNNKRQDNNK